MGNFREIDIHRVRKGQFARVYLMGRRLIPIDGIVQGISRGVIPYVGISKNQAAGEGVLSIVPPTFDFIQLATRFPVRIVLQSKEQPYFRIGGKASVIIDTRSIPFTTELKLIQEPESIPYVSPLYDFKSIEKNE